MNIFVTSPCPRACAESLDDRRVVKMILESAQMLSTSIHIHSNITHDDIYRKTHVNHPCTLWASKSSDNWRWLFLHMKYLCEEYTLRYNKIHRSSTLMEKLWLYHKMYLPRSSITPFVNCARSEALGLDFSCEPNVHFAYICYLIQKYRISKRVPTWTHRASPIWWQKASENKHAISLTTDQV
ncbi:pyrimidine dimer DNA glycosylase/endonuclease V [Candidatus Sneabacter namystus]|uniref:Uncharacterized protein n=1 Tax=Candidatus Sneabacter namystus TaxID=2601646 RepID=A0A5C0UGV9_9RICK|nr:pyrimidine dimer DNA glycosylase/endonuclease V [Candidatus Sneabacter namystus]QEK39365.1 hypothetical protein FZC37_00170 [Candidatus Sneabacter namystus]